ncbi:MAG: right-handed parallel beta-helix repeat-containing protein [Sandaracinaceae bacterium]|nr:right-handed parallel beta-helix repeat-containing protein [Sandaracinaceae bacterium]
MFRSSSLRPSLLLLIALLAACTGNLQGADDASVRTDGGLERDAARLDLGALDGGSHDGGQDSGMDASVSCGETHTVTFDPSIPIYNLDANEQLGLHPGDTLCMPAGDYRPIYFHRLRGTPGCPIRITNCGGLVRIGPGPSSATEHRLNFSDSEHFIVAGDGVAGMDYGIEIDGRTGTNSYHAIMVNGASSDYEIHHVYAHDHGVTVENVPQLSCARPELFGSVFTVRNPRIHHLKIRNGSSYGIYLAGQATVDLPDCGGTIAAPAYENVQIHDIDLDTVARAGIHLSHAPNGENRIHHNRIVNAMQGGITVDSDCRAEVYANVVNGPAFGVFVRGSLDVPVHDNLLIATGYGIQMAGTVTRARVIAYQNTMIIPNGNAAQSYSGGDSGPHVFVNNLIVAPTATASRPVLGFDLTGASTADIHDNLVLPSIDAAYFVDAAGGDYHLAAGSPAIGAGVDLSGMGVDADLDGRARSVPFDVGCYAH